MLDKVNQYILWRAQELKRQDPAAFNEIKEKHVAEFGDVPSNRTAVSTHERSLFWLHWLADWRVEQLKERVKAEAKAQKKRPRRAP